MKSPSINKDSLMKEYLWYKGKSLEYFHAGDLSNSLRCIEYCGSIAWFYPILYEYCDPELEALIGKIKDVHPPCPAFADSKTNRVVFYNSQIVDSGALTEQYLNYFIEKKFEVLFIIADLKNTNGGKGILKTIKKNPLITLYVASGKDPLKKIQAIENEIFNYRPQKAFIHLIPNDVVGFACFYSLKTIKRYYIVHNDHTFWFGISCSDYFIEFRKFGYLLANERRGIDCSKIFHLPYYPIKQEVQFEGFPLDVKGMVVGLSGGNLYKYYMDPELKYFHAIKELILKNENFIFFLTGWGDCEIVRRFIDDNNLNDRFIFLGKRNDFNELIGNIDILFESYPFKGGLTVLYGVENHKAITGIGDNRNASGCLEDFFDLNDYSQPQNIQDFIDEASQLIKSESARKENAAKFMKSRYNKVDFESGLNAILEGASPSEEKIYNENLKLDDNYYLDEYLRLPFSEFDFYFRKFFYLKDLMPLKERISLFMHLYKLNRVAMKKRILRYSILVFFGI
jgi:hypothetical protein